MAPLALYLFSALVGSSNVLASSGHGLKQHQARQMIESDFQTTRSILPIIDAGAPITFATTAAVPTAAQVTTTQAVTSAEVIATSTRREEEGIVHVLHLVSSSLPPADPFTPAFDSGNTATQLLTTAAQITIDPAPQVTTTPAAAAPPPLITTSAAPPPDTNTNTDTIASAGVSSRAVGSSVSTPAIAKATSTPAANVPPAVLTGLLRTTTTRAGLASTTGQSGAAQTSGAGNAEAGGLEIPGAKTGAAGQKVKRGLGLAMGAVVLGVVSMVM